MGKLKGKEVRFLRTVLRDDRVMAKGQKCSALRKDTRFGNLSCFTSV